MHPQCRIVLLPFFITAYKTKDSTRKRNEITYFKRPDEVSKIEDWRVAVLSVGVYIDLRFIWLEVGNIGQFLRTENCHFLSCFLWNNHWEDFELPAHLLETLRRHLQIGALLASAWETWMCSWGGTFGLWNAFCKHLKHCTWRTVKACRIYLPSEKSFSCICVMPWLAASPSVPEPPFWCCEWRFSYCERPLVVSTTFSLCYFL